LLPIILIIMQNIRQSLSVINQKFDPGNLALKRSTKTFIAILISLAIFWQTPGMAMFAAISSMLLSRSQVGFTINERRFTMLATGIIMIIVSVPVSLISQNNWLAVSFVVVASFTTFFLVGNRVVPDFPAISILALSVVEMAFSHTLESGLKFSGLFLMTTTLVYTLHFILWPTRPRKRLKAQIDIINSNLNNYNKSIHATHPDAETGMKNTLELSDNVRRSIGDFRRLWQLFKVKTGNDKNIESRYLDIYTGLGKIHEYLILLWQFRVSAWNSDLYNKMIIDGEQINQIINYLLARHDPDIVKPSDKKLQQLKIQIEKIGNEYLEKFKADFNDETHRGWVAIINAVKALETLIDDLQRMKMDAEFEVVSFSVSDKIKSFLKKLLEAVKNVKFSNPAVKFGIRSSIIIGATAAYAAFYEPEFGYWLVLFAVLLIRPNIGVSIKAGKDRLIGTIAGSLLAMVFLMVVPVAHVVFFIFLFLSVFLMLWFINLNRMIPMVTALTFMIVCLFYLLYPSNTNLVWLRISYTLSTVMLVIFVSFLLWPEKARKKFAGALASAIEVEKDFFGKIMNSAIYDQIGILTIPEKQKFRDHIQQLNAVIEATKNEVIQERVIVHGLNIRLFILRLLNTLQSMDSSSKTCRINPKFSELRPSLERFSSVTSKAFEVLIVALNERKTVNDFPDLSTAFENLRLQFREIKYRKGEVSENITQYWENSAFIWNLKPLTLELEGIKKEIELKMAEE